MVRPLVRPMVDMLAAIFFLLLLLPGEVAAQNSAGVLAHGYAPTENTPLVYLDPGHGGLNSGAESACGLREKELTLDIALRVQALLQRAGTARVLMSRGDDSFVGLRERTRHANTAGADLFLSIHVNANPSSHPRGVDVYLLAADSARSESLEIVRREEQGYTQAKRSQSNLDAVLHGLRLAGAQRTSAALAQIVLTSLGETTGAPMRGIRQAAFAVLKEATMPALVVEVGYLTHPEEVRQLANASYRDRIAEGLFLAIRRWRAQSASMSGRMQWAEAAQP